MIWPLASGNLKPRQNQSRAYHASVIRRANHTARAANKFAAVFEERSKRLDQVDHAIAKIRRLLRKNRKLERQQLSLVERAKKIRTSA
jgi:hypothetical protein